MFSGVRSSDTTTNRRLHRADLQPKLQDHVEAKGFKAWNADVQIEVATDVRADLRPARAGETVTISVEVPLINDLLLWAALNRRSTGLRPATTRTCCSCGPESCAIPAAVSRPPAPTACAEDPFYFIGLFNSEPFLSRASLMEQALPEIPRPSCRSTRSRNSTFRKIRRRSMDGSRARS